MPLQQQQFVLQLLSKVQHFMLQLLLLSTAPQLQLQSSCYSPSHHTSLCFRDEVEAARMARPPLQPGMLASITTGNIPTNAILSTYHYTYITSESMLTKCLEKLNKMLRTYSEVQYKLQPHLPYFSNNFFQGQKSIFGIRYGSQYE